MCGLDQARKALACVERLTRGDLVLLGAMTTRTGEPLSVKHPQRLAMVGGAKRRRELIAGIKRGGWTAEELSAQIRRRKGATAGTGGPEPTEQSSLESGLDQVDRHCCGWLKRHDGLWAADKAGWLAAVEGAGDAPPGRLGEVRAVLRRLARAAMDLEERLAAVEGGARAGAGPA
jgi:hypothetical protein